MRAQFDDGSGRSGWDGLDGGEERGAQGDAEVGERQHHDGAETVLRSRREQRETGDRPIGERSRLRRRLIEDPMPSRGPPSLSTVIEPPDAPSVQMPQVIAVDVVLHEQLPVRPHLVALHGKFVKVRRFERAEFADDVAQPLVERHRRRRVDVHEDHALRRCDGRSCERKVVHAQVGELVALRNAREGTIERVPPPVVEAADPAPDVATTFQQHRAAMPAHVVERLQPVFGTHHHDRDSPHLRREVIARSTEVGYQSDEGPAPLDQLLLLAVEPLLRCVRR